MSPCDIPLLVSIFLIFTPSLLLINIMIAYEIKTILYYNSIYGYGEEKPKFSFHFLSAPLLEEQGVPIYSEEGIRLRIKFCRRKIFASCASIFRLLAKYRPAFDPHAKQVVALLLTE